MPFGKLKSSSQKPEEISFSDILNADEIASAASGMVGGFVRILILLIVLTLSFVAGVYVGPRKEGKELRALITARITSLRSELHGKIEELKTAPEEAARPTAPASGEPEPGPLALSPNKPSATPAPTMEGGKTVAAPAETPLSASGPSDSTAVAPAARPSEQAAAPPVSSPPVDLVSVTQKMEGEIQGLLAKVAALEKTRNSSLEELSRRIDDAKSKTKAEVGALSSRVLQFQQETNTKLAEMTAGFPAKKPRAEPVESRAAPAVERSPNRAHSWRNDTFDPSQHLHSPREETKQPVGSELAFDRSQIRYCLSENIRMDAWEGRVNQYSDTSVAAFKAAVNDYNARCSHIRYRREDLESVRSEVDANRMALTRQGLAKAAGNP
jgi:hypothetical protein